MQHIAAGQLPPGIARPLWRFVLRRRQVALLRSAAMAAMLGMLWLLAWGVVDRFMPLAPAMRLVLLAGLLLLIARILRWPIRMMFQGQIDWRNAAWQIEQRDRRLGQALVTVVSETLAPSETRGSVEITAHLASRVESALQNGRGASLVDGRPAARAWAFAAAAALLLVGLALWPWLDLPRLVRRQLAPLSGAAPVTRSQIVVLPGTAEVLHGAELPLAAQVRNPGSEGVILRTTTDGTIWSSTAMTLNPDGMYTRTLTSLSRDAQYEVRTGDAVSGRYSIRVLHHPIVRKLRVWLEYPPYVNREPLTVDFDEDPIEVPAGTRARVVVEASEPLRSAWFTINGKRADAQPLADARSRQTELTISGDTQIGIQMVSDRGVTGTGPAGLMIRAIPDREPFARLLVPQGFSLLGPSSAIRLPYEVSDDYALASLRGRIEVDGVTRGEMPFSPAGEPHRQEGMLQLNLADWNVQVGQMIAVSLVATDRANQISVSTPVRILVSSETVLPEHRRRIAELKEAGRLASGVVMELESARRGLGTAQEPAVDQRNATARLALAAERSSRLIRSLLFAATGISSKPQARLYQGLIDAAQVQAIRVEQANVQSSVEPLPELRQRLAIVHAAAIPLDRAILTLWQGQNAEMNLAERRALAAVPGNALPELNRLREDIESETLEMGLEPGMLDVHVQLQARVEAADRLMQSYPPVDLLAAVEEWVRRPDPRSSFLPDRLHAAAQAEAVWGDSDLVWARDLRLAARAARVLEASSPPAATSEQSSIREGLHVVLGVLFKEHQLRRGEAVGEAGQVAQVSVNAARQAITGWAGESTLARLDSSTTRPQDQQIPTVSAQGALSAVSETRDQGIATIRHALEWLTEMPQLLYDIEQAAQAVRAARGRQADSIREVDAAPAEELAAAQLAVAADQETVNENIDRLADTSQTIDFAQPAILAAQLRRYLPDTAPAVESIERPFAAALAALHRAIEDQNAEDVERAIAETRRAIAVAQQTLRDSQATLRARDPTVIARSFAATTRPTTQAAIILDSLRRPWEDPLRRLIEPQFVAQQSTLLDDRIATSRPIDPTSPIGAPLLPRQWRSDEPSMILRDDDPPQYREALDVYFQILGASAPQGP